MVGRLGGTDRAAPHPRHIAAQQFMALCLQEHQITTDARSEWWGELPLFDETADAILDNLISEGYFEVDGPFLHIGPEAERRFGRRYFSDLTAVFTAPPEFWVLAGRNEVGPSAPMCSPSTLPDLACCYSGGGRGKSLTSTGAALFRRPRRRRRTGEVVRLGGGLSYDITRGMRDVILGTLPRGVEFTSRATAMLELRQTYAENAASDRLIVRLPEDSTGRWWTWGGTAANRIVASVTSRVS